MQSCPRVNGRRCYLTLKEFEDSLTWFKGSHHFVVRTSISDFKGNAEAVIWNDLPRFICAKMLLKGAAKFSICCTQCLKSWKLLTNPFIEDFGTKLLPAHNHRVLQSRKKNKKSLPGILWWKWANQSNWTKKLHSIFCRLHAEQFYSASG